MDRLTLQETIGYCNGKTLYQTMDDFPINDISTDSRLIQPGHLFVPLIGEKFDGHDFLQSIFDKGVQAVLIDETKWKSLKSRLILPKKCWIIGVPNTLIAYQDIAMNYLDKLNVIKIAITGSNGKTTTKEIIKTILSYEYTVKANVGNFNNQIGVPKTVFTIDSKDEIALIEMGTGKVGDINRLTNIVRPDIGIITSIGNAHTEFLGGISGVANEKGSLFNGFHASSLGILNEDDQFFPFLKEKIPNQFLSFSLKKGLPISIDSDLGLEGYILNYKGHKCRFRLGGNHNLVNLSFAITLAEHLKVPAPLIVKGIDEIKPFKMRSETIYGKYTIIKDCYNANPESMKAGLNFLSSIQSDFQKICVLGDMLELGSEEESLHKDVGKYLSQLNIDYLFTYGELGKKIADGALLNGFPEQKIFSSKDHQSLYEKLIQTINANDIVYVKGSRGMELEKVTSELELKKN